MAFEKLKKKLQETKLEKKQIAAANQQIRKKVVAASLQERERQELKLAIEKEKLRAGKKLETAKAGGRVAQIIKQIQTQARKAQARKAPVRKSPVIRAAKRISAPVKRRAKKKGKAIKRKASRRTAPPQQASPTYTPFDAANLVR